MADQNWNREPTLQRGWQVQLQEKEVTGEVPSKTWAELRYAFLKGMSGCDEGTDVRMAMDGVRMQEDNLMKCVLLSGDT